MTEHEPRLDLEAVRSRLAAARGKQYWRCLEELADSEGFAEIVRREYPRWASEWTDPISRRRFLGLMGASLALAGLAGCSMRPAPVQKIVPYVRQPEEIVPGKPLFFATAMPLDGLATGVLVESHEGRPTKIEGNPLHPASLGATDVFGQASILDLYDPDRSQTVTYFGRIRDLEDALAAIGLEVGRRGPKMRLRVVSGTVTSPTLADEMRQLLERFEAARWIRYDPVGRENARQGAVLAFGEAVNTYYRFSERIKNPSGEESVRALARVVLALDADFLACGPGHLRYVREFSDGRRVREGVRAMNRLYVVESTPTTTGAAADHRLPVRAGDIEGFARAVATEVQKQLQAEVGGDALRALAGLPVAAAPPGQAQWIAALVRDLVQNRGRSAVLAGDGQPPRVHALAHALNRALSNEGKTVFHTPPLEPELDDKLAKRVATGPAALGELADEMRRGQLDMLVILGGNPGYNGPADVRFGETLQRLPLEIPRLHLSSHQDETSQYCQWHIPESHYLEAWGDGRAFDGTVTIQQPLIAPFYASKSAIELVSALLGRPTGAGYEVVRAYWESKHKGGDFESFWRRSLHDGVMPGTRLETRRPPDWKLDWSKVPVTPRPAGALEVVFRPDPTIYDGRFANNGWLQELPKPLTRLTWDNAALMSPATATKLGLASVNRFGRHGGEHGEAIVEVVQLFYQGQTLKAPVWVMPGHPDDAITLHLGYGRTRSGRAGTGAGFNVYALRTSRAPWFDSGLAIQPTDESYRLASVQQHHLMEGRDIVRASTLREFQKDPHIGGEHRGEGHEAHHERRPLTLYQPEEFPYTGYKWGMAIDLSACVGCGACVVACQAENNIPVVGKEQVLRGREMHWLRIDTYYEGHADDPKVFENPRVYFQPLPCMQCENAPCELVCPVGATVHSDDGLNDMVYNRCVGTRYCSNNCPYKVRRFNFLQFADYATASLKLLNNPEVTVRTRGVMEKCTYCVQRIRAAEIDAKRQDRRDPKRPGVAPIYDGEVLTACQAACPAEAIVFGDLNDPKSRVAHLKAQPHDYTLLDDLNTRPRTTYLAAVKNPNPEIEPA
jgi:molybdopterin-containing oxidoreductase family iron-sulfur binding subunit